MPRPQILVCSYHKTGTVLFGNIMAKLCVRLSLQMAERFGMVQRIDPALDVVLLAHSLLATPPARPFRAIRLVRDPREIWVSGYLYHRRCREPWCLNGNFTPPPPIGFPHVPYAFAHRRERFKRDYLASLGGRSYQQNLLTLDQAAGLDFELARYTGCTLADMQAWTLRTPDVLDVRLEDVTANFDANMQAILHHLGFTGADLDTALEIARSEDISRMDEDTIAANPHIHSRNAAKWRSLLSPEQIRDFERRYGALITELGYERVT
jgi:hypothetical protein